MNNKDKCEHCRFFLSKQGRRTGLCRGAPPSVVRGDFKTISVFPLVEKYWWCGRFEPAPAPEPEPTPEPEPEAA